ncbi:MAG: CBS domain-containing protein [Spirochaetes bacterium]|nr:CBS domain-containing protein [Spirochaetota bacterium]
MNLGTYLEEKKGNAVNKISKDKTIKECAETLNSKRIGALVVTDDKDNLEGIVSERDILRKGLLKLDKSVAEIMTPKSKLITVDASANIIDVMKKFDENKIRHMPVLENEKVIGVISIGDVIHGLLEINLAENDQLKKYIFG